MIVYEVIRHRPYAPNVSYGFFLRKTSAENLLEKLKKICSKYYINDYYIEDHSVSVE